MYISNNFYRTNMVSIAVQLVVTTNCFHHFKAIQRRIRIKIPHFLLIFCIYAENIHSLKTFFSENMIKK